MHSCVLLLMCSCVLVAIYCVMLYGLFFCLCGFGVCVLVRGSFKHVFVCFVRDLLCAAA